MKNNKELTQLTKSEIYEILQSKDSFQKVLFKQACELRYKLFTNKVIMRGVIEISNHCNKRCSYCSMRCLNRNIERYRLTPEEIFTIAVNIKKQNIPTVFIQSGQDPHVDKIIENVVPKIKKNLSLNVILCVGEREKQIYEKYYELGVEGYIIKFETSDAALFKEITNSSQEQRLQCIKWVKESGMKLGTGNIVGLPGQSIESIVDDIFLAEKLKPDYVSSTPFIPNDDTPFENFPSGNIDLTLNTIALWRIVLKYPLIPAVSALEKIITNGQLMAFNAGANVITINFTPIKYRKKYSIYAKERFVVSLEHAYKILKLAGLEIDRKPKNVLTESLNARIK